MREIFDYFDARFRADMLGRPIDQTGPVITISRQTGCDGREVAAELVAQMNLRYGSNRWKWVDKDIIYHAAHELKTDTQRVETYYHGQRMTDISQMIMAFSGSFVTDSSVRKAVMDVVLSIARDGYAVIIGRGSVSITRDMANALHVRLVAPHPWRVRNVMKKKEMTIEKAEEYVARTDANRQNMIVDFLDSKPQSLDHLFDVTLNRSSFTLEQISSMILSMYEMKLGLKPQR